jgi:gamma-glutamyltranspeptidase
MDDAGLAGVFVRLCGIGGDGFLTDEDADDDADGDDAGLAGGVVTCGVFLADDDDADDNDAGLAGVFVRLCGIGGDGFLTDEDADDDADGDDAGLAGGVTDGDDAGVPVVLSSILKQP